MHLNRGLDFQFSKSCLFGSVDWRRIKWWMPIRPLGRERERDARLQTPISIKIQSQLNDISNEISSRQMALNFNLIPTQRLNLVSLFYHHWNWFANWKFQTNANSHTANSFPAAWKDLVCRFRTRARNKNTLWTLQLMYIYVFTWMLRL